jgi:hypothetical protein
MVVVERVNGAIYAKYLYKAGRIPSMGLKVIKN